MKLSNIALGGMVGLTVLAGASLASNIVNADDSVVDDVAFTVPVSCTMTGTGQNSHNAEVTNGTYEDDIGTTTLKVLCNDSEGFAIYAIGFTGDQYAGEDHTKLIGVANNQKIATGTATSGSASNWAMKLETDGTATYALTLDNGFGSYSSVPDSYTKVAHKDSGTDVGTSAVGATLTTTYAAFMSSSQVADTYSGKVKYTLVHPSSETPLQPQTATSGCINYFANVSDAVGTMGCQSISASDTTATLLASNFSRFGYGFAGWSDAYNYATNANAHFYGPQEDITFTAGQYTGTNNGLALYAVWVKSEGSIQDTSKVASVCNRLTTAATNGTANLSSVSALTDQRDNNTYAIAKLADGKCWMIENLRLESTNSDNSTGALAQGYGTRATYDNFSGLADAEAPWANNSIAANSLYSTDGANDTISIGTSSAGYRFPRYSNVNNPTNASDRPQNPTTNSATNSTTNAGMYSYGNYYTWHAAIADLNPNKIDNQSTTGTSLCPTGWHLPTGGRAYASDSTTEVNKTGYPATYREFYNLGYKIMNEVKTAYEDTPNGYDSYYSSATTNTAGDTATKAFRKYPNNFVYSGSVNSGSVNDRGSYGYYWSSTACSSNLACNLSLTSSCVYPGTFGYGKYYGRPIRCVASGV